MHTDYLLACWRDKEARAPRQCVPPSLRPPPWSTCHAPAVLLSAHCRLGPSLMQGYESPVIFPIHQNLAKRSHLHVLVCH